VGDKVSFDLDVHALGIDLTGVPIPTTGTTLLVERGTLNFRSQAKCRDNRLDCQNHVIIKNAKFSSGEGLGGALWGVPIVGTNGVLWFLDKTSGEIYIPFTVKGTLAEPEVDFARSFQSVVASGPEQMLKLARGAAGTVFVLGTDLTKTALNLGLDGVEKGVGVMVKTTETAVEVGKTAVGVARDTVEGVGKVIGKIIPGTGKKKEEEKEPPAQSAPE
jgi:hypothetical protein